MFLVLALMCEIELHCYIGLVARKGDRKVGVSLLIDVPTVSNESRS